MATTKKKSIWAIVGGILGLLAVTAAAIGIATAVRQNTCKHVWNDGEVKVEATCEKEGKLVFKCEECGKYETEKIEKLAHTWTYVEAKMPTCTEDGHTEYTACELCGEYKNGVEPQILLAEGHTEIELEAVAPTCTETGLTAGKYCTTCEEITVEQRSLAAKGHTLVTVKAVAPTCTETGLTAGQKCSTCDTVYVEQKEVPATGHTDANKDNKCDVCGAQMLPDTSTWAESVPVTSEKVAGKWYRVYRGDSNKLSIGGFGGTISESYVAFYALDSVNHYFSVGSTPGFALQGLILIETDEYIDFFLDEGTYVLAEGDSGLTFEVNEDTVIRGITVTVYCLIPPSV